MTARAKEDIRGAWPTLAALLIQTMLLAFFLGGLNTRVCNLQARMVEKCSCDRAGAIEAHVNRVDARLASHIDNEGR